MLLTKHRHFSFLCSWNSPLEKNEVFFLSLCNQLVLCLKKKSVQLYKWDLESLKTHLQIIEKCRNFFKRDFFPFNIWLSFLNGIYILLGSFLKMGFDLYLIFCSHLLSSDICNNSICGGSRNSHKNLKRFFHLKWL